MSPGSSRGRRRAPVGTGPEKVAAVEPPDLPTLESYGFERDPDMIESSRPKPSPMVPRPGEPMADEGVSEVELTGHVRRRHDDRVGLAAVIYLRLKVPRFFPHLVDAAFYARRLVGGG